MLSLSKPIDAPLATRTFAPYDCRRSNIRKTYPCRASSSQIQPSIAVQQHGPNSTDGSSGLLSNISIPAAVIGGAGLFVVWRLASQGKGSANALIERGLAEDPRERGPDTAISGSMKGVKRMEVPELSEDQILANRERRRRQLADYMPPQFTQEEKNAAVQNGNGVGKVDSNYEPDAQTGSIEVPKDHPWAVSKDLSKEEEDLLKERLEVSPRSPKKKSPKASEDDEITAKDLL